MSGPPVVAGKPLARLTTIKDEGNRMKRLLARPAAQEAEPREKVLPQRWVVILTASTLGGSVVGSAAEPLPWGVTTALAITGLLHSVMQ